MEGYTVPIVPPYNRIQPTPLCGPKIGGILKTGSGPSAFPLHQSGAADADPLASPMSEKSDALAVPVDVTMRQPSRRASAPISEMYLERVRTRVSRTDR